MNKLYIIAVILMGFTSMHGQITKMLVHETGGITTFQIANVDSVTYDTSAIATCPATITDARDGEVYDVIQIGNQCWMAENLRYIVPGTTAVVSAYGSWVNSDFPSTTYGRLYDWASLMNGATSSSSNPSGVQGICPSGWHLPSDSEWNELEMFLGMPAADTANTLNRGTHGEGMKSTTGWNSSGNGTNASGFNAFPAGLYNSGSFFILGGSAYFWSSTEYSGSYAWIRNLNYGYATVYRGSYIKSDGFSCRCVEN